jgi:hypothetical protein
MKWLKIKIVTYVQDVQNEKEDNVSCSLLKLWQMKEITMAIEKR